MTDSVQSLAQAYAESLLFGYYPPYAYPNVEEGVSTSFKTYAALDFAYRGTNDTLPLPDYPPTYDWWDATLAINYSNFVDYAAANRDTTLPFALFIVNHSVGNDTTYCSAPTLGISNEANDYQTEFNVVNPIVAHRFSFVFLADIQAIEGSRCGLNPENALIHTVIHEFGHQVAGLSDNRSPYTAIYHLGQVPNGRLDVMAYGTNAQTAAYPNAVFDYQLTLDTTDTTNCQSNLVRVTH